MDYYVQQSMNSFHKEKMPLLEAYFSNRNIKSIQAKLKSEVYKMTKQHIDDQSCNEIYAVMKYVYATYAREVVKNVSAQVQSLNTSVLNILVPMVSSNVLQYLQYIKDISSLPTPMERGKYTSIKSDNSLDLKPF